MKQNIYIIIAALLVLWGCKKDEEVRTSGTDSINNKTYQGTTYYIYGFSFSSAKLVSTQATPGPDIIIYVNTDNPNAPARLYFAANNLRPSFWKAGEYSDENAAATAFSDLKNVTPAQWSDFADPIVPNQIWIYRSQADTYTKIRTISTVNETRDSRPYGECTFEWVHQPDGSTIFP